MPGRRKLCKPPPAPPERSSRLTCAVPLGLAFLRRPAKFTQYEGQRAQRVTSPRPAPGPSALSGAVRGPPAHPGSARRSPRSPGQVHGRRSPRSAQPSRAAAPPSAPPAPLPTGELFSRLPRPTSAAQLALRGPGPSSGRFSAARGDSHHTPPGDGRLGEAQGRRERRAARRGPPRCVRGPWGPERTSRTWLPGAPVAMHPRLGGRLAAPRTQPLAPPTRARALRPPAGPPAPRLGQLSACLCSGAPLRVPPARPVLSLLFALSKHCPGHVSQQQPTHRSSLPPRRPPRWRPVVMATPRAPRGAGWRGWGVGAGAPRLGGRGGAGCERPAEPGRPERLEALRWGSPPVWTLSSEPAAARLGPGI